MKQQKSLDAIVPYLMEDEAVRAVFLKGSLGKGEGDKYSDVDLYCLVKDELMDTFLEKRIPYMEMYRPLIYLSEANFVGPQIVGVFDDGLHFDLYTVTQSNLKSTGEMKVLYDPEGLLNDYKADSLKLSEDEFIENIHEFSFTLLEFEAAYKRKDLIWASRLGHHLSGHVAMNLRYLKDDKNSLLGFKWLIRYLDKEMETKFVKAMDNLGPSQLPKGIIELGEIVEKTINELPAEQSDKINKEFFSFMFDKVKQLDSPL